MAQTGLEVFDTTVHTTNKWLNTVVEELGWGDRQLAYHALRATLQTVRDRLTVEVAANLGAQLPLLVRGVYYEGWEPARVPIKMRSAEEFLSLVEERYQHRQPVDIAQVTRAALRTLNKFVTDDQIEKVRDMLGEELRSLWPEPT